MMTVGRGQVPTVTGADAFETFPELDNQTVCLGEFSAGVGQAAYFSNANAWRIHAEAELRVPAIRSEPFAVDNLRLSGAPDPDKPQRWGSLFAVMRRRGIIEAGLYLPRIAASDVPGQHAVARLLRRWSEQ